MEFLETIESIRAEEASVQRLFGNEGESVRSRRNNPQYMARLVECATFIADVMKGKRPLYHLQEAMTTSDFPQLFGDVIDRQVLANYRETAVSWPAYIKRGTVRDFRTVKRFRIDGGTAVLTEVAERAPYPEAALTDDQYTYAVKKYGRRMGFSWESMVNDDLDALKDIPQRFGRAARRSEERFAADLLFGSTGPDTTHFASGNANIVTSNPVLSIAAMQTAFTVLAAQTDSEGEPILIDGYVLVIPPALEVVANNILNATDLWVTGAGGVSGQELHVVNWMRNKVKLAVNPYIPLIATTNGNTSWLVVADPNNGRPTAEMGFLIGHEEPEVFMKSPNAQRVGGGGSDPMNGDFDTDAIDYKVRHVLGGALMDPKMAVGSNGSGS